MRSELENLRVCGLRDRLNNTDKYSAICGLLRGKATYR